MNTVLDVQDYETQAELRRLRRENRYKMYYATRKIAKWTLIGVGVAAIASKVTNKTDENEV